MALLWLFDGMDTQPGMISTKIQPNRLQWFQIGTSRVAPQPRTAARGFHMQSLASAP
ncbi:hypothetical protein [Ancylobacter sp. SL191]|uniref:hypothetical protein n=1 Tax=Ancylobacter sp. SL191 TaxID=2995166 RepID=UPI00226E635C|nr:hypothetical protein [Ancylobacter sp. SL191]WAC27405.1 hypothetical protein OU996_20815 [Ancylobacter sp. SL191]